MLVTGTGETLGHKKAKTSQVLTTIEKRYSTDRHGPRVEENEA
jgi:hypothetical protein